MTRARQPELLPFNLAGVSFWPELWKVDKNLNRLIDAIRRAVDLGADVIATPEGILDGYITREIETRRIRELDRDTRGYATRLEAFREKQLAVADRVKAAAIPALREEAKALGVHVFVNSLDRRRGQAVYNTTFAIGPDGKIIGKYDKTHAYFEIVNRPGRHYSVFHTEYAPIGALICADRNYPETARLLALAGAKLIVINAYGYWGEGRNEVLLRQRARENGVFICFCHPAETVIVGPQGNIMASTGHWEDILVRRIDPAQCGARRSVLPKMDLSIVKHHG